MAISIEVYPILPSRPCSFCLCLQEGCVFADFNIDDANLVRLVRISFDGYGCCVPTHSLPPMPVAASRAMLNFIQVGDLNTESIARSLTSYFEDNAKALWIDALLEYELLPNPNKSL